MKYVAAYALLVLGGNAKPSKKTDITYFQHFLEEEG